MKAVDDNVQRVLEKDARSRRRNRVLLIAVAAVLVAGGFLYFVVRPGAAASGPGYKTAALARGDLRLLVTATGTLQARNTVDVCAEVTGRLIEVKVDFNDHVEPEQLLARIDPVQFEIEVSQAKARLLAASASLASAKAADADAAAKRERGEALAKDGLMSKQDLDGTRSPRPATATPASPRPSWRSGRPRHP